MSPRGGASSTCSATDRGSSGFGELVGLSQPNTSKHLCVLREAGLAGVRRDGQRRWYKLRPEPLAEVDAWLQPYRGPSATRIDALERHLDETKE